MVEDQEGTASVHGVDRQVVNPRNPLAFWRLNLGPDQVTALAGTRIASRGADRAFLTYFLAMGLDPRTLDRNLEEISPPVVVFLSHLATGVPLFPFSNFS